MSSISTLCCLLVACLRLRVAAERCFTNFSSFTLYHFLVILMCNVPFLRPKVEVDALLSIGNEYTVQLRKLDGTEQFFVSFPEGMMRCHERLSRELNDFYSRSEAADTVKAVAGDYIVFHNTPGCECNKYNYNVIK